MLLPGTRCWRRGPGSNQASSYDSTCSRNHWGSEEQEHRLRRRCLALLSQFLASDCCILIETQTCLRCSCRSQPGNRFASGIWFFAEEWRDQLARCDVIVAGWPLWSIPRDMGDNHGGFSASRVFKQFLYSFNLNRWNDQTAISKSFLQAHAHSLVA